jgi:hypothetical protein
MDRGFDGCNLKFHSRGRVTVRIDWRQARSHGSGHSGGDADESVGTCSEARPELQTNKDRRIRTVEWGQANEGGRMGEGEWGKEGLGCPSLIRLSLSARAQGV